MLPASMGGAMIDTVRNGTAALWRRGTGNPGLLFDRGLIQRTAQGQQVGEDGTTEAALIGRVAELSAPVAYNQAYERWSEITAAADGFARWIGRVDGRLILGAGSPHVLEAALTFSRPYGMPTIPGSSLKGIAHALAREEVAAGRIDEEVCDVLFGRAPSSDGKDMGDGGYLVFHDAWWVPDSAHTPCAAEVVTVHHTDYYRSYGRTPATDFDGPTPCPQLAARGSFLFAIEGVQPWANLGLKCLRTALEQYGVGGKAAAGYGYFVDDTKANVAIKADQDRRLRDARLGTLSPEERLLETVREWSPKEIAKRFGKDFNKTKSEFGENFSTLIQCLRSERKDLWTEWESASKGSLEHKAFKKLHSSD